MEMNDDPEPPAAATEPVPPAPPAQEDLLGRRSGAALIDVALLTGVFVIFGLTVGEISTEGGVYATLSGAWSLAYLAVVVAYYFVLEVAVGQSVGKRLLGLRVMRADGSRPSVAAIAVRTLLRLVDWLPFLYLVGFIAMLATGVRRQRLGDLAAKTSVARALPARHRGLALVPVALVAVLLALSAYHASARGPRTTTCSRTAVQSQAWTAVLDWDCWHWGVNVGTGRVVTGNGAKTYQGHGVSFEYPGGWQEASKVHGGGDALWRTAVGVGTDTHEVSGIFVEAYRIGAPVTAENLAEAKAELATLVRQLLEQRGGAVQSGPEELMVGGLRGLRFRGTATAEATPVESTLVYVFDQTTEYALNCQHTRDKAAEIQRGCDQIVRTFKVTAPGSATTA
jgi:uncharacterized RDD family membrane protein YckC